MTVIEELISFIESPEVVDNEREIAVSKLNLAGVSESEIHKIAFAYWKEYFLEFMEPILKDRLVIISHLLPDDLLQQCFDEAFEEYRNRKNDLWVDSKKYWIP